MSVSTLQVSGLSSGFDWRNMIDQLIEVDHRRVDVIENKKSDYEAQLKEWQSFNTKLQALNTAVEDLQDPESFNLFATSMSSNNPSYLGSDLLSVSTNANANRGTYLIEITNLATAEKLSSNSFTSRTEALGSTYAGDIVINGQTITIRETDSLAYVADMINNANTGTNPTNVTASIINYASDDYRLILTSDETGADGISLADGSAGSLIQAFGWEDNQIVAGTDAVVAIDGVSVTSSSNVIDGVIEGVTLNLLAESATTTITLNIDRDLEAIQSNIQNFVEKYNDVMAYINSQFTFNTDDEEAGGILFGDGTLRSVKQDLISLVSNSVWGLASDFSTLALVGIENHLTGANQLELKIDQNKLNNYLQTNFRDVTALFMGQGTATDSQVSYVAHTRDTRAGEYAIHITQAATRAETTGSVDLSGGGINDTLTITQGDNTAQIEITSDLSMNDIVNTINTELGTPYTQTIVGDEQLYTDGGQTSVIGSATTWDSIYNSLGSPLSFADGDIISFSGTTRNGTEVSGSYQITDITTGTVQGLLSAIESAYSNQVQASIDASGRIALQDINTGNSQTSLSSIDHAGEGEFFGLVDVSAGAGDGSQQGRHAIGVTASVDENNHLVLSGNTYGSNASFDIAQNTSQLGLVDGTYTGVDVAGTIAGEPATGSGQVLRGNEGNSNTEGLSILYRGTVDDVDAGTITVTIGMAEQLDRTLFNMTDSIDGYVTFKQSSLQDTISDIDEQVEQIEARLDKKMQRLINQFVAMELTLNQLQSQSDWLAGQTSALFNGWN
jgi:flagellar hook-associated protein 2